MVYRPTSGDIILTKTTSSGITITNPTGGIFRITLSDTDTASLLGQYNHEGEFTDTIGNISTLFTGYFKVFASKA